MTEIYSELLTLINQEEVIRIQNM